MKKQLKNLISILLLFSLLMGILVSCSPSEADKLNRMEEPDRAMALSELISVNGEAADSYTVEIEVSLECVYQEVDVEVNAEGSMYYTGLKGDSPAYHSSTTTKTEAMEGEIENTTRVQEGFRDGKMYRYYREDGVRQRLYSPISWEDFGKYMESRNDVTEFDFKDGDCTDITCAQQEDGSWFATMKGFTEDGITPFREMIADFEEMLGEDFAIADVSFTFTTTEDFYLSAFTMEYTFEALNEDNEEDPPVMKLEAEIGKYNATEPQEIDFDDYTEVVDLRLLDVPEKSMKEFSDGEKGKFQFDINQRVLLGTQKNELIESDLVSFANKDGKYTYQVEAEQNNYEIFMTYTSGTASTVVKERGQVISNTSEESTDEEAKAFIDGLLQQTVFDSNRVSDIEKKKGEKNTYIFRMKPKDNELLMSVVDSVGAEEPSKVDTLEYTATIEDDKLLRFSLVIDAEIETAEGTLYFDISLVYDFTVD